jgi:hypothetical protein
MSQPDRPRYLLELTPEPGPVPEINRLRRVLKALLRCSGLRCVRVEEVTATAAATGPASSTGPEPALGATP